MKTALTICAVVVAVTSPQVVFASLIAFHSAGGFADGALIADVLSAIELILALGLVAICVGFTLINSRCLRVVVYLARIAAIWVVLNVVALIVGLTALPGLATIFAASILVSILVLAVSATNAWANSARSFKDLLMKGEIP